MQQKTNLKKRIKSVNEIKQMTRALQLISAVKMRRAKNQLNRTMPFFAFCAKTTIELIEAGFDIDDRAFQLTQKKKGETWNIGYFIMTGDQGFAGAYNANVLTTTVEHIRAKIKDNDEKGFLTKTKLYVCGKIGKEWLMQEGFSVEQDFEYPISEPTFYRARDISDYVLDLYQAQTLDLVYFIFTKIESAVTMIPVVTRILPINPQALQEFVPQSYEFKNSLSADADAAYEPSVEDVAQYMLDTYLNAMVYGILAEAYASEQTSRMIAMDNATQNASQMQEQLTLQINLARQSRITRELTEIISGADALQPENQGDLE